jgi:hypothetical protein
VTLKTADGRRYGSESSEEDTLVRRHVEGGSPARTTAWLEAGRTSVANYCPLPSAVCRLQHHLLFLPSFRSE